MQTSEHNDNGGKNRNRQYQGDITNTTIPLQNNIINTAPANNNMSVFPQHASSQIIYQVKTGESVNDLNTLQPYFVNNKHNATVSQQQQQQQQQNNTINHNVNNNNINFQHNQNSSAILLDLEKQLADAYAKSNMLMNEINNNSNSNNDNGIMSKNDTSDMMGGTSNIPLGSNKNSSNTETDYNRRHTEPHGNEVQNSSRENKKSSSTAHKRSHSEPMTLNTLAQIFDDSIVHVDDNDMDQDHNDLVAYGWSSPPPSFEKDQAKQQLKQADQTNANGRKRSHSAPLLEELTENMFDLHNLEPAYVSTKGPSPGLGLSGPGQFSLDVHTDTNRAIVSGTGGGRQQGNKGTVKRSRSVDPLEMFRHSDEMIDNMEFSTQTTGTDHKYSLPWDDNIKPKRRRSEPLLSQDLFDDIFDDRTSINNDLLEQVKNKQGHADIPHQPQQKQPAPAGGTPEQQNNVNLLNMLLGVENEVDVNSGGLATTSLPPASDTGGLALQPPVIHTPIPPSVQQKLQTFMPNEAASQVPQAGQVPTWLQQPNLNSMARIPQHHQLQQLNNDQVHVSSMSQQTPQFATMQSQQQQRGLTNINQVLPSPSISINQQIVQDPFAAGPLSMNNSQDLNLILMAVKETQTNLQTIRPLILQLGDPVANAELSNAFQTASSTTQFILASDLPCAYEKLNEVWKSVKKLEDQLKSRNIQQQQQQQMVMPPPQVSGENRIPERLAPPTAQPTQNEKKSTSAQNNPTKSIHSSVPKPIASKSSKIKTTDNLKTTRRRPAKSRSPSPPLEDGNLQSLPPQSQNDAEVIMARLHVLMKRTKMSQRKLEEWDQAQGLPKSHCQTMVNSSRSRKQLTDGVILKKWNGAPLLKGDAETETEPS